jgi:tetratricopeptide (TPR) repeat protein
MISVKHQPDKAEAAAAQIDPLLDGQRHEKSRATVEAAHKEAPLKPEPAAEALIRATSSDNEKNLNLCDDHSKVDSAAPDTKSSAAEFCRSSLSANACSVDAPVPSHCCTFPSIPQVSSCEPLFLFMQRVACAASERERGLAMYYGRKNPKAVEHFTNAVKMHPEEPLSYFHRAAAQQRMGLTSLAIQDIEVAYDLCSLSPPSPEIHVKIVSRAAKLLQASAGPKGFNSSASRDWRVACVLWSHAMHISSAANLPKHSVFVRNYANAVSNLQKCYKLDIALEECANADRYLTDRNNAAALIHYNKAVAMDPDAEHVPGGQNLYLHRAFCRLWLGDVAGALADAHRATQLHPNVQANWMGLASMEDKHGGKGGLRRSIVHAARGLDFFPGNSDLSEHLLCCFLALIDESVINSGEYLFILLFAPCDE